MDINDNHKPRDESKDKDEPQESTAEVKNIIDLNVECLATSTEKEATSDESMEIDDLVIDEEINLIKESLKKLTKKSQDIADNTSNSEDPNATEKNSESISVNELMEVEKSLNESSSTQPDLEPLANTQEENIMEKDSEKLLKDNGDEEDEVLGSEDDLLAEVTSPKQQSSSASSSVSGSTKKTSFVDSLLNKFRKSSDSSSSELSKFQQAISEPEEDLLVEVDIPVRYSKPSNPNQLPTPLIKNQNNSSVFVNTVEEYQRTVAKHKSKKHVVEDRNMMNAQSEPPRMTAPLLPANMQRPRTLADKRILVNNDLNFLIVEQETKIFRQVQRREQKLEISYQSLDVMMAQNIPIKHGPWRVLTWLRTRQGNYIQQYLDVDDVKYKLSGSRGDHTQKTLPLQSSEPMKKYQKTTLRSTRCCSAGRIPKRLYQNVISSTSIRRFVLEESVDQFKRLETKRLDSQLGSIKPRPLSKKIEIINKSRLKNQSSDDDGAFLGDYAKFEMPKILLEVQTKPKSSLDPCAKKYLNEILPHHDLNEKWCEFALSALKSDKERITSFDFEIPFNEDKNNILVREITRSKEDNEPLRIPSYADCEHDFGDPMEWTFAKDVDPKDPIESEVAEIIKDLTNSVFINLNDDLFTQEDPHDRKEVSAISPMKAKQAIDELSNFKKPDKANKVLIELKRLNANFFMSEQCVDDENYMRRHATAHLSKVERELRSTVILTGSETVLLGNQEKDSRRIKRVPKKFDDYENTVSKSLAFSDSERDDPPAKKARTKADDFKTRAKQIDTSSPEEIFSIKTEVHKMLHVSVDLFRFEHLEEVEPWCMIHKLYKCHCKGAVTHEMTPESSKKVEIKLKEMTKKMQPPLSVTPDDLDDGFSRRVLPIVFDSDKLKTVQSSESTKQPEALPKLDIVNLCDLINGEVGPIIINIYDDKTIRLNQILRTLLNNKSAIIYFDGFAYFVDKTRVDIDKLDFSKIKPELEHPIFIVQPKDSHPATLLSTNADDFVNFLLHKKSKAFVQITEPKALKSISEIIESILRNVRRKVESTLDGKETSPLVREQLMMITRDRSRSTSMSSTNSSPLSFHGHRLREAPAPGLNTPKMQEFNKIFSVRMQRIVSLVAANTLGLKPSNEMLNRFYIYRWRLLLQSFEEDLVQIWQVMLEGESNQMYEMLVLTDSREVPEVEFAKKENIVNIRKLKISDNIAELARMILLRVENAEMINMMILFYGCKGYMRICGILNSKGFIAKPNRSTHPRIAAKIQKAYNLWHESRMREEWKKIQKFREVEKIAKVRRLREARELLDEANEFSSISTALKEEKKPGQSDFKWFLFNITNDFSDIFIKSWSRYLSYKVIMEAIRRAKTLNRAVALETTLKNSRRWPKIFALPSAPLKFKEQDTMTDNFLIFGPYMRHSNSNLLLMQNVDGEVLLRDDYEKKNNIMRTKRTRCLWIYANSLKCIHDAHPVPFKLSWNTDSVQLIKGKMAENDVTMNPETSKTKT